MGEGEGEGEGEGGSDGGKGGLFGLFRRSGGSGEEAKGRLKEDLARSSRGEIDPANFRGDGDGGVDKGRNPNFTASDVYNEKSAAELAVQLNELESSGLGDSPLARDIKSRIEGLGGERRPGKWALWRARNGR